jgi:hypothetical protein
MVGKKQAWLFDTGPVGKAIVASKVDLSVDQPIGAGLERVSYLPYTVSPCLVNKLQSDMCRGALEP